MKDKIELLSESLIDDYKDLALEVMGYAQKFGKSLGWHYILDMVWVLKELALKKNSTVLAAGAGLGLLQFILADKGYQVVSVDVNQRKKPDFINNICHVEYMGTESDIPHLYWDRNERKKDDIVLKKEENYSNLPMIVFYHSNLDNMKMLEDNSIDAMVSISALEHNSPEKLKPILSELSRVLKSKGKMYLTISTALEDFFHEASYSWVLNEESIVNTYRLKDNYGSNFNRYDEIFSEICQSKRLQQWLASFYYHGDKNGMPYGKWEPAYQPLGVLKVNS